MTSSSGEYLFRTIKPGLYPGRTRHIHVKVKAPGLPTLTSQIYVLGEPQNANDGILNGTRDPQARNSVIVPFTAIAESPTKALGAKCDIVLSNSPVSASPSISMTNMTDPSRTGFFRGRPMES